MFGKKKLQKQIDELFEKVWHLENKPKFKNGDKVYHTSDFGQSIYKDKEFIVVDKEIDYYYFMNNKIKGIKYTLYNEKESCLYTEFQCNLILTTDVEQTNNTTSPRD